jgi:Fur family peroxide stress response transcriptional regulator
MAQLKYSKQREAIKNYLQNCTTHPTADVVYTDLRKEFPNISLGTVYRNLSLLADLGEIRRISTDGDADFFDGNMHPHDHFICTRCHRVYDIELREADELIRLASMKFPGHIESYLLNFFGTCEQCTKETDTKSLH